MKRDHLQLAKWLVAELEVFAEIDLEVPGITDPWITGMLRHGIPFTPSYWSGDENPRQKMRLVRTAKQLERIGLLKRVTEPNRDRTTHVIPSPELISDDDRPTWRRSQRGRRHFRPVANGLGSRHRWPTRVCGRRRGVCGPLSQPDRTNHHTELSNDRASPDCFFRAALAAPTNQEFGCSPKRSRLRFHQTNA